MKKEIIDACEKILSHIGEVPDYVVVLGSGLSFPDDVLEKSYSLDYKEIPGFPKVGVTGHHGILTAGNIFGKKTVFMKGRFHYYEGHTIENVVFPIRVFLQAGVKNIVITNAAGGINPKFKPGDIMAIKDHISFFCDSPLRGENIDEFGPRFPDQSHIYNTEILYDAAKACKINLKSGVYAYAKGPMYETPAEIRSLSVLGADAVGMSTVPEAIVASHGGMDITGISCITNYAAGISDEMLTHEDVLEVGKKGAEKIEKLIIEIIKSN